MSPMENSTQMSQTVALCVKDALSTDEGRPLQETQFEYDQEGMLKYQYTTVFTTSSTLAEPAPLRETRRDAYGILVGETLFGEEGGVYAFPKQVVYEKGTDGLVERVTVWEAQGGGIVYFIAHHGRFPHRRGLPHRVRHLAADGSLQRECRYEYDSHAHLVSVYVRWDLTGEFTLECCREFQYDDRGKSIRLTNFEGSKIAKQYVMQRNYDENGLCAYAVFMEDPDTVEENRGLIPGFFHDYTYAQFPQIPNRG